MKRGNILIVDDNPANLKLLDDLLTKNGYEIRTLKSGKSAIKSIKIETPELILLDIMMPEMDGYEVCKKLKNNSKFKDIPIIFISAKSEVSDKVKAFEMGGVDYITKPFEELEILARVDTHLKLYRLQKNLKLQVKKEVLIHRKKDRLLIQQSKMATMGEMVGSIAHQWKQPLNALSILIQEYLMVYEDGELDRNYLIDSEKKCINQIDFMNKTIEDFKNFLKPNKEKVTFCLKEAIKEVINLMEVQFLRNSIEIILNDEKSYIINGFANEFKQVVLVLLINSKDAILEQNINCGIDKKCYILIEFSENDDFISISFKDNGGGIDEKIQDRLFELYSSTKGKKGTGIGLYMSKIIIEESFGGKLMANNTKNGAEFIITLPKG